MRDEDIKLKAGGTFNQHVALTTDYAKPLENAKAQLESADTDLVGSVEKPGPLAARRYKDFVAQASPIRERLSTVVVSAAGAKADLGAVTRNDIVSPLDSLAGSKSHLWVDWLGDILKKREDDKKDKLLLSNMLNEHPGLEHAGGVVPGRVMGPPAPRAPRPTAPPRTSPAGASPAATRCWAARFLARV